MKISVVMGTRPGIVKMAPIFNELSKNPDFIVELLYTGQHYSSNLKDDILSAFNLPEPNHVIRDIDLCSTHAEQISAMMIGCEKYFLDSQPDIVLVCGDANTNLAAGLAARKTNRVLCHVESGLRSFDWSMPEEHNRVMLDHISDILFAPTEHSAHLLSQESVRGEIHVVGNSVVDSLQLIVSNNLLSKPNSIEHSNFILATTHRQENVDSSDRLKNILTSFNDITSLGFKIYFPMHPRTEKMINKFGFTTLLNENIIVIPPVKYEEMLWLIKNATVILTDSGGLQEEACVLGTPCVTLRDNTERPESVDVGANIIAGVNSSSIFSAVNKCLDNIASNKSWSNPFGNGDTSIKIAEIINEKNSFFSNSLR